MYYKNFKNEKSSHIIQKKLSAINCHQHVIYLKTIIQIRYYFLHDRLNRFFFSILVSSFKFVFLLLLNLTIQYPSNFFSIIYIWLENQIKRIWKGKTNTGGFSIGIGG